MLSVKCGVFLFSLSPMLTGKRLFSFGCVEINWTLKDAIHLYERLNMVIELKSHFTFRSKFSVLPVYLKFSFVEIQPGINLFFVPV